MGPGLAALFEYTVIWDYLETLELYDLRPADYPPQ